MSIYYFKVIFHFVTSGVFRHELSASSSEILSQNCSKSLCAFYIGYIKTWNPTGSLY